MSREFLRNEIEKLNERYRDLKHEINVEKSQGSLSKLCNLNMEFDETFDSFFDDVDLRKKYDDYDYDEECIKLEKTSDDLLKEFDEEDLRKYIEFYNDYILQLESELEYLKEHGNLEGYEV